MKLDWRTLDWIKVGIHQHLFLTTLPPVDYGPFWLLEYQKTMDVDGQSNIFTGRYIVDADLSQLVASVELAYLNSPYPTIAPEGGDYYIS